MQNGFNVPVGTFLSGLRLLFECLRTEDVPVGTLAHSLIRSLSNLQADDCSGWNIFQNLDSEDLDSNIWTQKTGLPGNSWLLKVKRHKICGHSPTFNLSR